MLSQTTAKLDQSNKMIENKAKFISNEKKCKPGEILWLDNFLRNMDLGQEEPGSLEKHHSLFQLPQCTSHPYLHPGIKIHTAV